MTAITISAPGLYVFGSRRQALGRGADATVTQPLPPGRLTVRGRRVRATLLLVALAGLVVMLVAVAQQAAGQGPGSVEVVTPVAGMGAIETVEVAAGQSLWDVAHAVAPDRDPREVVHLIREENLLRTPVIHPGQKLKVPESLR